MASSVDSRFSLLRLRTLVPAGHLVALLQQQSRQGQITESGVTSLEAILPIMSLHTPGADDPDNPRSKWHNVPFLMVIEPVKP